MSDIEITQQPCARPTGERDDRSVRAGVTFLHHSCYTLVLKDPNYDAAVRGLAICRFVLFFYLVTLAHCAWG